MTKPKILLIDIETAPILGYCWDIWQQNIGLNQIKQDWHLISWAAKWLDEPEVFYADQRSAKNVEDDKKILGGVWKLLDEADVVITQNGRAFDEKKLNARFIIQGFQPPSSYKHIDTKLIAKRRFGFTSNKLEYLCDKLNKKYKKEAHKQFPGFDLWKACLEGKREAWDELEKYNKMDVLALEELYHKLAPWDNTVNFALYRTSSNSVCKCGSTSIQRNGYAYTAVGKFQRYKCASCGHETRGKHNVLSPQKRASLTR